MPPGKTVKEYNESMLIDDSRLPLVIQASAAGTSLSTLLEAHRSDFEQKLLEHGALLFRGFDCKSTEDFDRISNAYSPNRIEYTYRSTPRSSVADRIYTTTEYPAQHTIALHNENAYARVWPLQLMFGCLLPSLTNGATPLADMQQVTASIDQAVVEEFAAKKVMYVRHYGEDVDIPWQTVFQTDNKDDVAKFCLENGIEYAWLDDDEILQTRQICQGTALHPVLGKRVFFNQAHLFHVSNHGEEIAEEMISVFGADRLPRNAFFGDGSEIPSYMLEHIREAFNAHSRRFPWQAGDCLLIDNMQVAHGREPYTGPRKVLAALFNPHRDSI
jgi:alpha-ketoglutarate-dependent taurine dioxygenase